MSLTVRLILDQQSETPAGPEAKDTNRETQSKAAAEQRSGRSEVRLTLFTHFFIFLIFFTQSCLFESICTPTDHFPITETSAKTLSGSRSLTALPALKFELKPGFNCDAELSHDCSSRSCPGLFQSSSGAAFTTWLLYAASCGFTSLFLVEEPRRLPVPRQSSEIKENFGRTCLHLMTWSHGQ